MDLDWTSDDLAFRDEVREFLDANLTPELRAAGRLMTSVYSDHDLQMEWQRRLHARGWAAPAWPVEHGGAGWTVAQRYIYTRERVFAGAPPVSPMGIQMCGPAIIEHGTTEQKAYFLPRMLSGEHFWCQGYSEPGAGSDLASLQMRAESDGDDFILNGSKIWNTHADVANWCFCLVRTTRGQKPQQGITFLLLPMDSPGISVKPIVTPSGERVQNEIFFTDVRVPKTNVVGRIDEGWTVAKHLLEFERGGVAYAPELQARLDLIETAAQQAVGRNGRLCDDPAFQLRVAEARIRVSVLEVYEFRAMSGGEGQALPAATPSVMKVLGTELAQSLTELGMEVAGRYGMAYQPQAGIAGGPVLLPHSDGPVQGPDFAALAPLRYLNERAGSIYAGSNEIQRNILAKLLLA